MVKIFVVDDDPFLGNLIKTSLEKMDGVEVTHFSTPEECLKNLIQHPHIVTIDYMLPGMNGEQLLEQIKNFDESIQCIMVSGQEKIDVVLNTYKKGAVDYIIKNETAIVNIENAVKKCLQERIPEEGS